MGNCCERCFGRLDKRKYLRTRYNVERDFSIEFENLMEDEPQPEELSKAQLQLGGPFTVSSYMRWLVRQEEELREEEEAYYEAKREAAMVARQQKQQQLGNKPASATNALTGRKGWVGEDDSDWEVAAGEDDFEMFLESVRARSMAARTRALPAQVPIDQQSTSSITSRGENSRTEASSIDLEWEHEAGMAPPSRNGSTHPNGSNHGTPTKRANLQLLLQQQQLQQQYHHHHLNQQQQQQQQQQQHQNQQQQTNNHPTNHQLTGVSSEITIKPLLLKDKKQDSNDFEWDNDDFAGEDIDGAVSDDEDGDEKQTLLNAEDRQNDNDVMTASLIGSTTTNNTTSGQNHHQSTNKTTTTTTCSTKIDVNPR